jgi:uncharacterized protein (DUF927 family)
MIEDCQDSLTNLCKILWPQEPKDKGDAAEVSPSSEGFQGTDEELIAKMFAAKNGEKVKNLWEGDTSKYGDDDSAADAALMSSLAFWCGKDAERMERIFGRSHLAKRDKWKRDDYRERTIKYAIEHTKAIYMCLPQGFSIQGDALWYTTQKDGEPRSKQVCKPPVEVVALGRDDDHSAWSRVLRFKDPDGNEHIELLPYASLSGDGAEARSLILDLGVTIYDKGLFTQFLQESNPKPRVRTVEKIGWHDRSYVLPDQVISADSDVLLFQGPERHRHGIKHSGTPAEWREHVGKYCRGNSRLIFAASCAFAGPLIKFVSTASPGFHFVGKSSLGKTTALAVGVSPIGSGDPLHGFIKTWRATANGVEINAAMRNHNLLALDEMAQVDPKEAGSITYLLANGRGKLRMRANTSQARLYEWQLVFLSTGEVTLEQHANEAGKKTRGGQRIRCLDIPADAGAGFGLFETIHEFADGPGSNETKAARFADHLREATRRFYGAPFLKFLHQVVSCTDQIVDFYTYAIKIVQEALSTKSASGEVSRAAHHFALIGAAGEVATAYGITGFVQGECAWAAATCYKDWLEKRGTAGASDEMTMVNQVLLFLELHGESRFEDLCTPSQEDSSKKRYVLNRAGVIKNSSAPGQKEFVILPQVFREEICKGFDHKAVEEALIARGIMLKDGQHNLLRRTIDTNKRERCYVIPVNQVSGLEQNHVALSTTDTHPPVKPDQAEIPF